MISKRTHAPGDLTPSETILTIDAISQAYQVLSTPALRAEYDRDLRLQSSFTKSGLSPHEGSNKAFGSGVEIMDLDDLQYDEKLGEWYKACRCGEARGFVITEANLEADVESLYPDGLVKDVSVECRGCSLWIRVGFEVDNGPAQEPGASKRSSNVPG
jgi:diphthamide biosynthesis protein 4